MLRNVQNKFLKNKVNFLSILIAVTIVIILFKSVKLPLHTLQFDYKYTETEGSGDKQFEYGKSENEILHAMDINEKRQCYRPRSGSTYFGFSFSSLVLLNDISKYKVQQGNSIFFLQTACSKTGIISLNARQACAIESAALWNPHRQIYVLFASPVGRPLFSSLSPSITALKSYDNINLVNVDLDTFVIGTPVEQFHKDGTLFESIYCVTHMSDFLRFLVLYKYGGIYLDVDVVVQKSLDELPANFCGTEKEGVGVRDLNVAVFGLQNNTGHYISEICLWEIASNFSTKDWGHNGPNLIKRVLDNSCSKANRQKWCHEIKIFPKDEFYAIGYDDWNEFFESKYTENVLNATKNSAVVHLWNKFTYKTVINKSKKASAYGTIATKNCPLSYQSSGEYF